MGADMDDFSAGLQRHSHFRLNAIAMRLVDVVQQMPSLCGSQASAEFGIQPRMPHRSVHLDEQARPAINDQRCMKYICDAPSKFD